MSGTASTSSGRANLIEAIMFCTYALFAVNWIAGTTLTPGNYEIFPSGFVHVSYVYIECHYGS